MRLLRSALGLLLRLRLRLWLRSRLRPLLRLRPRSTLICSGAGVSVGLLLRLRLRLRLQPWSRRGTSDSSGSGSSTGLRLRRRITGGIARLPAPLIISGSGSGSGCGRRCVTLRLCARRRRCEPPVASSSCNRCATAGFTRLLATSSAVLPAWLRRADGPTTSTPESMTSSTPSGSSLSTALKSCSSNPPSALASTRLDRVGEGRRSWLEGAPRASRSLLPACPLQPCCVAWPSERDRPSSAQSLRTSNPRRCAWITTAAQRRRQWPHGSSPRL